MEIVSTVMGQFRFNQNDEKVGLNKHSVYPVKAFENFRLFSIRKVR